MAVRQHHMMETYHGFVRSPADAIKLFEACRLGLLPRVQRRLSEKERQSIRSGSVFVWDEREAGMRRWTDGKSWSASRVSGSFLTYREMEGKRGGGFGSTRRGAGKTPDSGRTSDEDLDDTEPDGYRYKTDGLMKQSFSITTSGGNHLHLISYFGRQHNQDGLPVPTTDPALRHIVPMKGMYPESSMNEQPMPATTRTPMASAYGPPSQSQGPSPQYQSQYAHQSYPGWPPSPVATPPYSQSHYTVSAPYPATHLPPPNSQPYPHAHAHAHAHPHSHSSPHSYMQGPPPHVGYERASLPPPINASQPRGQPPMLPPYGAPQRNSPHLPPARPYQESPRMQHLQAKAAAVISDPRMGPTNGRQMPGPLPSINGHHATTPPPRALSQSPPGSAHSVAPMSGFGNNSNKASLSALLHPTPASSEPNSANPGSNSASSSPRAPYGAPIPANGGAMTNRLVREVNYEDARAVNMLNKKFCI